MYVGKFPPYDTPKRIGLATLPSGKTKRKHHFTFWAGNLRNNFALQNLLNGA